MDTLAIETKDILIDKNANDVFYNAKLLSILEELKVTELVITGCATDFCVESTVQSALTKDFDIRVVSNGHTTGERPNLTAQQVLEHYMIPTKGQIRVASSESIVGRLSP